MSDVFHGFSLDRKLPLKKKKSLVKLQVLFTGSKGS